MRIAGVRHATTIARTTVAAARQQERRAGVALMCAACKRGVELGSVDLDASQLGSPERLRRERRSRSSDERDATGPLARTAALEKA